METLIGDALLTAAFLAYFYLREVHFALLELIIEWKGLITKNDVEMRKAMIKFEECNKTGRQREGHRVL